MAQVTYRQKIDEARLGRIMADGRAYTPANDTAPVIGPERRSAKIIRILSLALCAWIVLYFAAEFLRSAF